MSDTTTAPKLAPEDRLAYRPEEAFRLLGIGRSAGYAAIAAGALPARKVGGRYLVPRAALDRWLESA
ncbi:MAG: helix-turn-helix domain-containing protein [Actinomycetota bacterium]